MKREIIRQSIHVLFGSLIIAFAILFGVQKALLMVCMLLAIGIVVALLLKANAPLPAIKRILEKVEREHESFPGQAAMLLFFGAALLMTLTQNKAIVVGALCVAVYGDAASTIFGLKLGKHRIAGKKTLEGTLGGILASILFLGALFALPIAFAGAVIGMLAELLPIDDSITMPIATAVALNTLTLLL